MVKETTPKSKQKKKKKFTVTFYKNWCKSCGICSALCVTHIIKMNDIGEPYIDDMNSCIGCRFCEIHCPDFAITIKARHPERRRTDDNR